MSIRPIREVPAAREVAELISDFDRPSFGTLRGVGLRREHAAAVSFGSSSVRRPLGRCGTLPESIGQSGRAWHPARRSPGRPCAFRV